MAPTSAGQDPGTPDPAPGAAPAGLIWTRPPAEKRERPTREAIVAAAIDLADAHGLEAVSVRKVAAALATRPMDLYRYFARKDELIDLMVDEVVADPQVDVVHTRQIRSAKAQQPDVVVPKSQARR
jgi:AcrR family transcriptional regulator